MKAWSPVLPVLFGVALGSASAWANGGVISATPDTLALALGDGEAVMSEICVDVPAAAVVPKADVYLLADTTGSMYSVLDAVKSNSSTVVADLYDNLGMMGIDVRIGVGNYKDFPYDPYAFDHQLDPVSDAGEASVLTEIGTWMAGGGADGPEAQLFALDRLAGDTDPAGGSIGWRDDAKKLIVWFGDSPGHDPICNALTGIGYDINEGGVTGDLVEGGFTVIAISTTTGYVAGIDDDPVWSSYDYGACGAPGGAAGQATRISTATGGSFTSGINASTIVATIVDAVAEEAGTIGSLGIVPSAELLPYLVWYDPPVTDITVDEDATYCFDMEFLGECNDDEPMVYGMFDVVADGAVVDSVDVELTLSPCCPVALPPEVVVSDPINLWPPSHVWKEFDLSDCVVSVIDECEGELDVMAVGNITSIYSDEVEDGLGDGNTSPDAEILSPTSFRLRSERSGTGTGRTYFVAFTVADSLGNAADASCEYFVPHDKGKGGK